MPHVICGLGPPIKNPGYANAKIQEIFMFGFFLFNQSKTRTRHFRGLVGFEAKAKDLSFEVKAKDFKICPRGRPRGQDVLEDSTSEN